MNSQLSLKGISIIVSSSNFNYADNIYKNYTSQDLLKKELIIVVNKRLEDFDKWLEKFKDCPMVRVYQLDESNSLGECLNYCVEKSIYDYVAIFDERYYYGPQYLSISINGFKNSSTSLLGKNTYFVSDGTQNTVITKTHGIENALTNFVILPTFIFKRELYKTVMFSNNNSFLDQQYCNECIDKGLKILASNRYNFIMTSNDTEGNN